MSGLEVWRSVCTFHTFFVTVTASTEIYTLSLHDALPIFRSTSMVPSQEMTSRTTCLALPRATQNSQCKTDRKSTRLNSSHVAISYAVFCLKKKIQLSDLGAEIAVGRRTAASDYG